MIQARARKRSSSDECGGLAGRGGGVRTGSSWAARVVLKSVSLLMGFGLRPVAVVKSPAAGRFVFGSGARTPEGAVFLYERGLNDAVVVVGIVTGVGDAGQGVLT
jgi:hypothetical protein